MKFSHSFLFLLSRTNIFDFMTQSNIVNSRSLISLCSRFWIMVLGIPRWKLRRAKNFFVHLKLE